MTNLPSSPVLFSNIIRDCTHVSTMTNLPSSPVLFSNIIREHVPPVFNVVAIGGNRGPSRVEVLASPDDRVSLRWDGDAWVHDEGNNVRVLLTTAGLVAFLHGTFAGYYA